jgi:hypothetical protein
MYPYLDALNMFDNKFSAIKTARDLQSHLDRYHFVYLFV